MTLLLQCTPKMPLYLLRNVYNFHVFTFIVLYSFFFRSGMLESGVDRIITQVVDPKMNHIFRPQIETAIHDFLSGDRKEEGPPSANCAPCEQTETEETPYVSGPKTP